MAKWNETDVPLAYLITVRTYGTLLHGDKRGSVSRFSNKYDSPRIPFNGLLQKYKRSLMRSEPVLFNRAQRKAVERAIREVCLHRKWKLLAINVRTNHFHVVVVTPGLNPSRALNAFKAYATRKMREEMCWVSTRTPWVDKGSERWLWNDESIANACDYVVNGQGSDLSEFDKWNKS